VKRSTERFLTTHVGSLVRPTPIADAMQAREHGLPYDAPAFEWQLRDAVEDVVRTQAAIGIDVLSDGELSKLGWCQYLTERLSGLEYRDNVRIERFPTRDRMRFDEFFAIYEHVEASLWSQSPDSEQPGRRPGAFVCTGPIRYEGHEALRRDIANFQAAVKVVKSEEAFLPAPAPGSVEALLPNQHYKRQEDYLVALADALNDEYRAIVEAGLLLQVDDSQLTTQYQRVLFQASEKEAKKWATVRVDALNHALNGIPTDRVRYHVCWGSQNVPHTSDVPLRDLVELLLRARVGAYAIESANPRHEHEWQVWQDVKLPADRVLLPGLVSHATNIVEHPELVAWRLANFASAVGRENVIASTDCGFAQDWAVRRVHPAIQWAKLEALVAGARLASAKLWGRSSG
jgi:5-methyltetrahydropteroyltriglutamate--homocysteine methyltransferase